MGIIDKIPEPKRRRVKITAYDGEWYKMRLRLFGAYDEQGYRWYESAEAFLAGELVQRNAGRWYYAHAGGLADILFLIHTLVKDPRYSAKALFSGSSAVILKITRGRFSWSFIDSLFTLKGSLRKIGEKLGFPKGDCAFDAPLSELIPYNRRDCEILYRAITTFQEQVVDLGSELKPTLASTALRLIRRQYWGEKVFTSKAINERLRPAYLGGRTEVFIRGRVPKGAIFDINSSYPHAMRNPLPGSKSHSSRTIPDDDAPYIADVTVTVPIDTHIPTLPMILGDKLIFPVGTRRQLVCRPELELAISEGARIERVHMVDVFTPDHSLSTFSEDLYRRRTQSEGYEADTYKRLLNSAYGKFAERSLKTSVLISPTAKQLEGLKSRRYDKGEVAMITPGVFLVEEESEVTHAHIPLTAYITSLARAHLSRLLIQDGDPIYCDTDSIMTTATLPTSDALGGLKLEKEYVRGVVVAPKLYALEHEEGEHTVKAKGYAKVVDAAGVSERLNIDAFRELIKGGHVVMGRMKRLREMLGAGELQPSEIMQPKLYHGNFENGAPREIQISKGAKRYFRSDGTSRAWAVDEYMELLPS